MTTLRERPTTHFAAPTTTAPAPARMRGLRRDEVRMLVAAPEGLTDRIFCTLADHLLPGDVVVVNNSAVLPAQLDGRYAGRGSIVVHLAARLDDGTRVIELRSAPDAARSILDAEPGAIIEVDGATLTLLDPYPYAGSSPTGTGNRLWRASVDGDLGAALSTGRPISYGYLDRTYPLEDYQSVFSLLPGSAESPSAGLPFTDRVLTSLVRKGIGVVPVTLHTGVSSQEAGEGPHAEWFAVPAATAETVNRAAADGNRVVAVGTTVTRALESAIERGRVRGRSGWTTRVVTPADPPRIITGLITGWHDPMASHLLLVEAVAGAALAQTAYDRAATGGYRWHEFGDSALFLP